MAEFMLYVVGLALVALAGVAGYWLLNNYLGGQSPMTAMFGERPEKRLAVVDHASVDGRRRLVLIRRDGVEHLIMTGGPVDVVIETGIGEKGGGHATAPRLAQEEAGDGTPSSAASFGRAARTFGRAPQQVAE